jgi:RNA polymerase sigma factor (TIGR02999 family)
MPEAADITTLLAEMQKGDRQAESRLLELVYHDLRRIARRFLQSERRDHTLQPTELVNEAYMRLTNSQPGKCTDRVHFFALAARVMRRILIDYARGRNSDKRRAGNRIELQEANLTFFADPAQILILDEALKRLAEMDERSSRVVEMRVFGGLTETEIAEVLGVTPRTVKRDWRLAKTWLHGELSATPRRPRAAGV